MHKHRDAITLQMKPLVAILRPSAQVQPRPGVAYAEYHNDERYKRGYVPAHMSVKVSRES